MMSELLMPFIEESEEFVLGFECGQIWESLKNGKDYSGQPIHTENSAQVQMICDHFKVKCKITVSDTVPSWSSFYTNDFSND